MDARVRSLAKRARVEEPRDVEALIAALRPHLRTKREFEDAFEDAGSADAFAARIRLSESHRALLLRLQAVKDIFVPNPALDGLLTAVFLTECVLVARSMAQVRLLGVFLGCLLLTDAVTSRVKHLATVWGGALSRWLHRRGAVDHDPLASRIQMKKWADQSWQLAIHVGFSLAEGWLLTQEPWYTEPESCWRPHPFAQQAQGVHRVEVQLIYVQALAIWVYTCLMHRFFDERKRDYFVMYVHHCVTIALVGVSWSWGYVRIGLLVMYVHDVSDIFVDLLKMVNYLKLEGRAGWFGSELAYAACVASWIYYRLYLYPARVIYAAFAVPWSLFALPEWTFSWWALLSRQYGVHMPYYMEMNVCLAALLVMHVYWGYLLLMVGYRILTESAREASRREYEGDSDAEAEDGGGEDSGAGKLAAAAPPMVVARKRKGAAAKPVAADGPAADGPAASAAARGTPPSPSSARGGSGSQRRRGHSATARRG